MSTLEAYGIAAATVWGWLLLLVMTATLLAACIYWAQVARNAVRQHLTRRRFTHEALEHAYLRLAVERQDRERADATATLRADVVRRAGLANRRAADR